MKFFIALITCVLFSDINANTSHILPKLSQTFHNVRDFTVYNNEAYFSAQSTLGDLSVIIKVKKVNDAWSSPEVASFSGIHHDIEPFITSDGLKLFFASKRPKTEDSDSKDYDIWYVIREGLESDWSQPINMGTPINTEKNEFYPSLADNGNLYFTANYSDSKGKDDIYISELIDGEYTKPKSLPEAINTAGDEYNAFISSDESYIIFGAYKRADGLGSGDLYISYKVDGQWVQAQNMGPNVNSKQMDYCPFVDAENLYFTSRRNQHKTIKFNNIEDLTKTFNAYENGMSRIYKTELIINHPK